MFPLVQTPALASDAEARRNIFSLPIAAARLQLRREGGQLQVPVLVYGRRKDSVPEQGRYPVEVTAGLHGGGGGDWELYTGHINDV